MAEAEETDRISRLEDQLSKLREEVAGRKPVEQIVKYLLFFWFTISVVLGFLGWKELSGLDQAVEDKVIMQLPGVLGNKPSLLKDAKSLLEDVESLFEEASDINERFKGLSNQYQRRKAELEIYDVKDRRFDIGGKIQSLLDEFVDSLASASWRADAVLLLEDLKTSLEERRFPADVVYNSVQLCRRLRREDLSLQLTKSAYENDSSPSYKAMKLASAVQLATGGERDSSFAQLLDMVRDLDYESVPHIVMGEAWNAAENMDRQSELLVAIDDLLRNKASQDSVPSHVYVIRAPALLRKSSPGCRQLAIEALGQAEEAFRRESSIAQWHEPFLKYYGEVCAALAIDQTQRLSTTRQLAEIEARIGSEDRKAILSRLSRIHDIMLETGKTYQEVMEPWGAFWEYLNTIDQTDPPEAP